MRPTSFSAARVASVFGDLDTEQTLLALKVAFLVLLYLFIWAVVRSVTRDLRSAPQESIVLSAKEANELRARYEPVVPTAVARLLDSWNPAGALIGTRWERLRRA